MQWQKLGCRGTSGRARFEENTSCKKSPAEKTQTLCLENIPSKVQYRMWWSGSWHHALRGQNPGRHNTAVRTLEIDNSTNWVRVNIIDIHG